MSVRRHHTCHTKASWESSEDTRMIRRNHWLITPIDDDIHAEIHRIQSTVPLLDHNTARRTRREFEPMPGDYIATMYRLMRSIESAIKHPRAGHIEKGLGQLTVYALEQQVPLIREGLVL